MSLCTGPVERRLWTVRHSLSPSSVKTDSVCPMRSRSVSTTSSWKLHRLVRVCVCELWLEYWINIKEKNKANFNNNKSSIKNLIASMQNPDSLMQWMFLDRVLSLIDVLFLFLLLTFLSLSLKAKFHNLWYYYVYSKPQELDKPQKGSSTTCIYLWNCFLLNGYSYLNMMLPVLILCSSITSTSYFDPREKGIMITDLWKCSFGADKFLTYFGCRFSQKEIFFKGPIS